MDELKATYDKLDKTWTPKSARPRSPKPWERCATWPRCWWTPRRRRSRRLNQAGFSVSEYEWVRNQVYAAVGVVAAGFDVKKLAEQAKAGNVAVLQPGDEGVAA